MMHFFDPTLTHRPNLYRISGPDAADYLHRMTTANINALHSGKSTPGLFLTAQGRIKCMFTLRRVAEQDFYVEFETAEHFDINFDALIEEFRFAEKLTVEKLPWSCLWILDELSSIPETVSLRIDHSEASLGRPWVSLWASHPILPPHGAVALSLNDLEYVRIQSLAPRLGHEIVADQNPLDVHLDWAIAPNKGCYPGQEVIEKIISLGAPARRLCRLHFEAKIDSPLTLPLEIRTTPESTAPVIGKLTSLHLESGTALGILRKTEAQPQKTVSISTQPNHRATVMEIA